MLSNKVELRRISRKRAALLGALLLPGSLLAQFGGPTPVRAVPAKTQALTELLPLQATALPFRRTFVPSRIDGVVAERVRGYFSVRVETGDVLARLDDRLARAQLAEAEAEYQAALAQLEEAEAGPRQQSLKEARALLAKAKAQLAEATIQRDRFRDLQSKRAATRDQLDQAERRFEEARQEVEASKSRLSLLQQGTRKEALRRAHAQAEAARARRDRAQLNLDFHEIRAPFPGFVSEVYEEEGNWMERGARLLEIVDLSYLDWAIDVPSQKIPALAVGSPVDLEVAGPDGIQKYEGKLVAIGPQATMQGRNVAVVVRMQNLDPPLRSQIAARAYLPIGKARQSLVIPRDALAITAQGGRSVFVVKDSKAEARPVTVGFEGPTGVEVLTGLEAGELVVTRGNENLRPGQEVKVVDPDAKASTGGSPAR